MAGVVVGQQQDAGTARGNTQGLFIGTCTDQQC